MIEQKREKEKRKQGRESKNTKKTHNLSFAFENNKTAVIGTVLTDGFELFAKHQIQNTTIVPLSKLRETDFQTSRFPI